MKVAVPASADEFARRGYAERYGIVLVLVLAGLLRAYHLTAPPIGKHQWRQADTAAIARNYYEGGYRFFHPQIDWRGAGTGYVEMEFPIYCYAIALIYSVTGVCEAVGRALSLLASLLAIYALYRLVTLHLDRKTALWACLFYAILPLNAYSGRAIMPESWMLAASVAGVYFFARWSRHERWSDLTLSALCISLACLLKLTSLYLGLPLLWLAWRRRRARAVLDWRLWLFGVAVLAPVVAWYAHAHALGRSSGLSFGVLAPEKWGLWQLLDDWDFYKRIALQSLAERHFAWFAFFLFLIGLSLPRRRAEEWLFDFWLFGVVVYVLIAQGGNYAHDYYQLPFLLPGVVYIGKVFARGWPRHRILLTIALLGTLGVSARKYSVFMYHELPERSVEVHAAQLVQQFAERGELVVLAREDNPGDPTLLYLCDRKGWLERVPDLSPTAIRQLAAQGAGLLVTIYERLSSAAGRQWLDTIRQEFTVLHDDGQVCLCDLAR